MGLDVTINIGNVSIVSSISVRELGTIWWSNAVRGIYANIQRIAKIKHHLDKPTSPTLKHMVLSRQNSCSTSLSQQWHYFSWPKLLKKNWSGTRKRDHISSVLVQSVSPCLQDSVHPPGTIVHVQHAHHLSTSVEPEVKHINLSSQQATLCTIHLRTVIHLCRPQLFLRVRDLWLNFALSR